MSLEMLYKAVYKHVTVLRQNNTEFFGKLRLDEVSLQWRMTLAQPRAAKLTTHQIRSLFTRFDYDHRNVSDIFSDDEFAFLAAIVMENIAELLYIKVESLNINDSFHLEEPKQALFESIKKKFLEMKNKETEPD